MRITIAVIVFSAICYSSLRFIENHFAKIAEEQANIALSEFPIIDWNLLLAGKGIPGFSVEKVEGPDFDVYYGKGENTENGFGIYVGFHPSPHKEMGFRSLISPIEGYIGNFPVLWYRTGDKENQYFYETIAFKDEEDRYTKFRWYYHVWIYAPTKTEAENLIHGFKNIIGEPVAGGDGTRWRSSRTSALTLAMTQGFALEALFSHGAHREHRDQENR